MVEISSGILYWGSMLLIFPINCRKPDAFPLQQVFKKTDEMLFDSKNLLDKSIAEHGLSEDVCNKMDLEWFSEPVINKSRNLFKQIDQNLIRFTKAFKILLNEHKDELSHEDLTKEAIVKIEQLRHLIQARVKPENSTTQNELNVPHRSLYQKKLDCCIILNMYKEFLQNIKDKLHIAIRDKRTRRKRNKY